MIGRTPGEEIDPEGPEDPREPAERLGAGWFGFIGRVEFRLAQICIAGMTALVLVSAITRSVGRPTAWAVDIATFLFAWAVFLGADVAWRRSDMVSIGLVVDRLPRRLQSWINLLNLALIALFLLVLVITGSSLVNSAQDRGLNAIPALSFAWVTAAVPVGCAMLLMTTVARLRHAVVDMRGTRP